MNNVDSLSKLSAEGGLSDFRLSEHQQLQGPLVGVVDYILVPWVRRVEGKLVVLGGELLEVNFGGVSVDLGSDVQLVEQLLH